MADHVITLKADEEDALLYAVSQAKGGTAQDIIKQWVDKGLGAASAELDARLKALGPLPEDRLARVKRAIMGQPEPTP